MNRALPFVIIGAVGLAAVTSGALLYRAKVAELTPVPNAAAGSAESADTQKTRTSDTHVRGNPKGTITIEEFGDFQCPPCATFSQTLERVEHDYTKQVRVVFRHFPLQMHKFASFAAGAAEAAGMQGRFWEMHDLLYKNQATWSKAGDVAPLFTEYAQSLGIDISRFREDVESPALRARIQADQQRASTLGVTSTPTVFVNGNALPPSSLNEKGLRAAIDAAIRGEPPPTATPALSPPAPVATLPVPTPTTTPAPQS